MTESTEKISRAQLDALGAAFGVTEMVDPVSLARALGEATLASLRNPVRVAATSMSLARSSVSILRSMVDTALGRDTAAPFEPPAGDKRFRHPAWEGNFWYHGVLQAYLAAAEAILDTVDGAALPDETKRKAEFAAGLLVDALARVGVPVEEVGERVAVLGEDDQFVAAWS